MTLEKRQAIKLLIEYSTNVSEAKERLEKYTDFKTLKEKIAFLQGMFDAVIVDRKETDTDEFVYELLLNAIIGNNFEY